MMGRQSGDQSRLFYLFDLERRVPAGHLLRRINPVVTRILGELREKLVPFYSEIGRPSIDPELMIRMLIVSYCYGIRFERWLCEEVEFVGGLVIFEFKAGPFCTAGTNRIFSRSRG